MTRVEVLVILGSLALLALVATPLLGNTALRSQRAVCVNNLRQIAVGFRAYAMNNQGKYPWIINTNMTLSATIRMAAAELGTPRIMVCPGDSAASRPADDFTNFNSALHLSYFLNNFAQEHQSGSWLAGDCNISPRSGRISSGSQVDWSWDLNNSAMNGLHLFEGNIALVDGRVQQLSRIALKASASAVLTNSYPIFLLNPRP